MIVKSLDAINKKQSAKFTLSQLADPAYMIFSKLWDLCDDVFAGEGAVKAKAETYIYRPESKSGKKREKAWLAYVGRGEMPDNAAKTLGQMVGTLGSTPPDITLDGKAERLRSLETYCTPYGDGLVALFNRVTEKVIRHGRYCLLLEPDQEGDKFHINEYNARKFLRCKIARSETGGETYASMILLDTSAIEYDTKHWRDVYYPQITLLGLDGAGRYYQARFGSLESMDAAIRNSPNASIQMIYSDVKDSVLGMLENFDVLNPDPAKCTELTYPTKYAKTLDRIPFVCINPLDLSLTNYQNPPLLGLCEKVLHILNADCNYQTSLFMTGDPQPVVYGANKKEMSVGSDSIWWLPAGASFRFESVSGAGLNDQAQNIQRMKEEARSMGLSLTGAEGIANTPVGTMNLYRNAQTAGLAAINQSCGNGVERVLRYAGQWIGMTPEETAADIRFVPSSKFAEIDATAAECVAVVSSPEMPMTKEEKRKYIEQNGIVPPRPWDEVSEELDREKAESQATGLNSVAGAFGFTRKPEEEEEAGTEEAEKKE